jgi:hypothetical protein
MLTIYSVSLAICLCMFVAMLKSDAAIENDMTFYEKSLLLGVSISPVANTMLVLVYIAAGIVTLYEYLNDKDKE